MNIVYFDPGLTGRLGHNGAMLHEFDQALVIERGHQVQYLCHQSTRRDDVPDIAGTLIPAIRINGYTRLDGEHVLDPVNLERIMQVLAEDYRHADLENADVILMPTVYPLHLGALVQNIKLKANCRVVLGLLLPCSYWNSDPEGERALNTLVIDSIHRLNASTTLVTYSETGSYEFGGTPITMATLLPPVATTNANLIRTLSTTPPARPSQDSPVVGFFGAPFTSKGFGMLIETLQTIVRQGLPVHIQLRIHLPSGHADICTLLNGLAPWIHAESSETSNAQYLRKMADVDIVWACYDPLEYNRKMSGIVPESVSLGKPLLLAEGCDAIQDFLERYAPGAYVSVPYAPGELIAAVSMPTEHWLQAMQCAHLHAPLMQGMKSMARYLTVIGIESPQAPMQLDNVRRGAGETSPDLRDEAAFAQQAHRLGATRILDIGSRTATFVPAMRALGFSGSVISVATHPAIYQDLLTHTQQDLHWTLLPGPGWASGETLNLPSEDVVHTVDAIKIHASLIQDDLLGNLIRRHAGVKLIWIVEYSADQASVLQARGFRNISEAPGMYAKETVDLPGAQMGIAVHAVVTSIGGTLKRQDTQGNEIGADWLQACIQSWAQTAPTLVSISETEPPDERILWDITTEKPYISEVIARLQPHASRHFLLTNADILLTDALRNNLATLDPDVMYYGHRYDVEVEPDANATFRGRDYWRWGYDVFLLPPALIASIQRDNAIPAFLRYGEPWWDYCLPILAMAKGFPIKNIKTPAPISLHLFHEQKYSQQLWVEHGERFLHWLESLRHQAEHPIDEFLELVLGARPGSNVVDRLQHASNVITSMMP